MTFATFRGSLGTSSDCLENDMDIGTTALLPAWILGAPLVLAIIDRFMTPAVVRSNAVQAGTAGVRTMPPRDASRVG